MVNSLFKDRKDAGIALSHKLKKYKNQDVVVYALPRGGVVTAKEIAKYLNAPLDLIIARKIGHPRNTEYAIASVANNGHIIRNEKEVKNIDKVWFENAVSEQKKEIGRRRKKYLGEREEISAKGKIAILVDDGVATGLTVRVGILELRHRKPKKIVVALPVIPKSTADILKKEVDDLIAIEIPEDSEFKGAVGAYYEEFPQVTDEQVIKLLT